MSPNGQGYNACSSTESRSAMFVYKKSKGRSMRGEEGMGVMTPLSAYPVIIDIASIFPFYASSESRGMISQYIYAGRREKVAVQY